MLVPTRTALRTCWVGRTGCGFTGTMGFLASILHSWECGMHGNHACTPVGSDVRGSLPSSAASPSNFGHSSTCIVKPKVAPDILPEKLIVAVEAIGFRGRNQNWRQRISGAGRCRVEKLRWATPIAPAKRCRLHSLGVGSYQKPPRAEKFQHPIGHSR